MTHSYFLQDYRIHSYFWSRVTQGRSRWILSHTKSVISSLHFYLARRFTTRLYFESITSHRLSIFQKIWWNFGPAVSAEQSHYSTNLSAAIVIAHVVPPAKSSKPNTIPKPPLKPLSTSIPRNIFCVHPSKHIPSPTKNEKTFSANSGSRGSPRGLWRSERWQQITQRPNNPYPLP